MRIPIRTTSTASACLLITAGLFGATPSQAATPTSGAAESAAAVTWPSNCDQLNKKYRHGISNRHLSKRQWIKKGATAKGAYRPKLYKRVKANLDRDHDHIACES